MMRYQGSISVHLTFFVALSLVSFYAGAKKESKNGVPFQLDEIQEQLILVEDGLDKLEETVDEIASADRSICDRPVSWNRKLPAAERFALALNGGAHCDLETGLIWIETPSPTAVSWYGAINGCRVAEFDGRKGWNLPTVEQLATLLDSQNMGPGPALPLGHPFKGSLDDVFWTTSTQEAALVGKTLPIWLVDFGIGIPITRTANLNGSVPDSKARAWCVRGAGGSPPITEFSFFCENSDC